MSTLLAAIVVPALVCLSGVGAATWLGLRAGSAAWTLASSALLGICICGIVGPAASIVGLPVPATTLASADRARPRGRDVALEPRAPRAGDHANGGDRARRDVWVSS